MEWIAAVLAIFLFYQFVEKKHKLFIFKLAGIVSIFFAFAVMMHTLKNKGQDHAVSDISVTMMSFQYHGEKESRDRLIDRLFSNWAKENHLETKSSPSHVALLKASLFPQHSASTKIREKYLGIQFDPLDDWDILSDEEMGFLTTEILDEDQVAKEDLERANRYIATLEKLKATNNSNELVSVVAFLQTETLTGKAVETISSMIGSQSVNSIAKLKLDKEKQQQLLREAIYKNRLNSKIEFKICNNKNTPLKSYSFNVSGFAKGRSTAYALDDKGFSTSTHFEADFIVPAKHCKTIEATNNYLQYSSHEVTYVSGKW